MLYLTQVQLCSIAPARSLGRQATEGEPVRKMQLSCRTRATLLVLGLMSCSALAERSSIAFFQLHSHRKSKPAEERETGGPRPPSKPASRPGKQNGKQPTLHWELVVARFDEDLGWLAEVPELWNITVYNKVMPARCLTDSTHLAVPF